MRAFRKKIEAIEKELIPKKDDPMRLNRLSGEATTLALYYAWICFAIEEGKKPKDYTDKLCLEGMRITNGDQDDVMNPDITPEEIESVRLSNEQLGELINKLRQRNQPMAGTKNPPPSK